MRSTWGFLVVTAFMSFLACGCGGAQDIPTVVFKADFDPARIEEVEVLVDEIAGRWNLRVFRKDKKQMSILTQGEAAFFVALYLEQDPIVVLTNVGVSNILSLVISDLGSMHVTELDRLTAEIVDSLEQRLEIDLVKQVAEGQ